MTDRFSADELSRRSGDAPRAIDLAHAKPFRIGHVEARPASRELVTADGCELLEPLMMQVLVAMHSAKGATLSRDDLVDACWGGRAVSDDAISRVVSRLRAMGKATGGFTVETMPKIGYRLVEAGQSPSHQMSPALDRRTMVLGASAAAAGVAGIILWAKPWRHRPPREALDLFNRGEIAMRQGIPDQTRQAISFYKEAVRIDPAFSRAWGTMALGYTHILEGYGVEELVGIPAQLRSAAKRALELDPDNADANLALIGIRPIFRNWIALEKDLRNFLKRFPDHWLAPGRLASLLYDVGRLEDALPLQLRGLEIDHMLPVGEAYAISLMSNSDRLQDAESRIARAEQKWPAHPSIWAAHYQHLLINGRPLAAAAFAANPDARPETMERDFADMLRRLAEAVDSRRPAQVAAAAADAKGRALANVLDSPSAAAALMLLGQSDAAFEILDRYFFDRGPFGRPAEIQPLSRRYARGLFARPFAPMREDPRFASLLRRTGLEDYWRRTGTVPDFRR